MKKGLFSLIGLKPKEIEQVGKLVYEQRHLTFYDAYENIKQELEGKKREAALIILGKKISETQVKNGIEYVSGQRFNTLQDMMKYIKKITGEE